MSRVATQAAACEAAAMVAAMTAQTAAAATVGAAAVTVAAAARVVARATLSAREVTVAAATGVVARVAVAKAAATQQEHQSDPAVHAFLRLGRRGAGVAESTRAG